ncbi:hypothetical protein HB364_12120 [Pseudoflavitalea sp. X16]|uniref:hypothetical protein n=1 Tax=Paraflavitalea devenefica TaxID=2716334 RepID=UPI001422145F|nr:hypothetical protein [Paraflavitalea devenefica]NII25835.1 hypothetical protein [Paraflavitalea devenefica]
MKKIKFMLLSLSLVGVVGGALAFKAKFLDTYCVAALPAAGTCGQVGKLCTNKIEFQTTTNAGDFVCTTTPNAMGNCPATLRCTNTSTKLKIDL